MFNFWLKSPLFEAAGDGAGSGGGDGAGAANSGAATFDPAAFKTEIMGELNKTINGFGKTFKNDFAKLIEGLRPAAGAGSGAGSGSGSGDGAGSGSGDNGASGGAAAGDPKVNALQLELKKLRETSDARIRLLEDSKTASDQKAEQMALGSSLRDVLAKYEFMSADAAADAVALFTPQISKADDGSYVAGDLPLDKFVEQQLASKKAYLLKAKDVGGAGARAGRSGGTKKFDLDTVLKPENFSKLTPAEQAEVRQQVANAL